MSRIEELIEKLCPNGVEYKKLDEVCNFNRGTSMTSKNAIEGDVPVISGGQKPAFYHNASNRPAGTITIAGSGAYAGYVAFWDKPIFCADSFSVDVKDDKILDKKFLCYYLLNKQQDIYNKKTGAGIAHVHGKDIAKFKIPVPPLEVQCEIVHILDDFTLLSALLSAELKARQKQYEYYNYNLLKFENIPYYTLEELCDIVDYRGKTPKKTNEGIFLVTAKNIRKGYIDYEKSQEFISEQDYAEVMRRGIPKVGDVLITTEAPCGNVAQVDDENIALAQRVIKYRPKDNRLDSTFLKYILLGEEFQTKLNGKATGGTVKGIKGSILHKLTIPLPSIEEQRKIVKILDRFNKLCNDISEGLPAEINARQKQYEYYRDKILTFKMIGD